MPESIFCLYIPYIHLRVADLSKPSVHSVCEFVLNIVLESRRVERKYVGIIDWLVSYAQFVTSPIWINRKHD